MNTFAERLKKIINIRGISQAEAARLSGFSQQSMNYIVNNQLESSKLAPKIAEALNVNLEWLMFGKGKMEETKFYELPILHSAYMLKKFLLGTNVDELGANYLVMESDLGEMAFAYLYTPKTLAVCHNPAPETLATTQEFLTFNFDTGNVSIQQTQAGPDSFAIYEWRKRYADF